MPEKLKAVLVGCGGISAAWLDSVKDDESLEIAGLVDINEDAAKQRREQYGLAAAVIDSDLEKVLSNVKPDVVFNCTVPEAHAEVTIASLKRGCHVLCEKPLAENMEDARRMVAAAREQTRIFAVVQNRRYDPKIRAYTDLIASGKLGKLTTLNTDFYIGAHFGGFRDKMKHVLLIDMAIHTFDAARLVSGCDPVAVYCKEWNPSGSWYDHDASAVAVFEMTGGVVYTYRGSWCSEGLNTTWESDWRALCETGSATWDGAGSFKAQAVSKTGAFFSEMADIEVKIPENEKRGGHGGVIREFLQCVRTGGVPETAGSDNIKSLAMVLGAVESAETGKRVAIRGVEA
ncbi:MAG: Gfo/Idh/MocA family oxidoreductase [Chloroflexi bacterium]|nr:Gfo/Idh/MocA family oxidoreductase [Chloroflexota bacterium]